MTFVVYDGRACGGRGTDRAQVMVACETLEEARSFNGDFGEVAIYSYEDDGSNEKWIEDYRENK